MPLIPVLKRQRQAELWDYWDHWAQPDLHRELQASQGYKVKTCPSPNTTKQNKNIFLKKLDIGKDKGYWPILTLEINFEKVTTNLSNYWPVSTSLTDSLSCGILVLATLTLWNAAAISAWTSERHWLISDPDLLQTLVRSKLQFASVSLKRMHRMGTGWDWAPGRKLIPQQQTS